MKVLKYRLEGKVGFGVVCVRWQTRNISRSERHCAIENIKCRCFEAWFKGSHGLWRNRQDT